MSENNPNLPRRRRAERNAGPENPAPQRAGFPPEGAVPPPPQGQEGQPFIRQVPPQVYEEAAYHPPQRDPQALRQPVYDAYDDYDDDDLPPRRWPLALLSLLLLLILLIAGSYFLIPKDAAGVLGTARGLSTRVVDGGLGLLGLKKSEPPRLVKFDTPEHTVQTGVRTVFTFIADKALDSVRVMDEVGTDLGGVPEVMDAPNNTTWTLTTVLTRPQTSTLTAEIRVGSDWLRTDKTLELTVAEPTATPVPPTATPEPPVQTPEPPVQTPEPPALTPEAPAVTDVPALPAGDIAAPPETPATAADAATQAPVALVDLLPVFTPAPPLGKEPEFPDEDIPADMLVEFPDEDIPADMLAEFPDEDIPADMLVEFPDEDIPEDMLAEVPVEAPLEEPVQDAAPAPTPAPTATPMPALVLAAAEGSAPDKLKITEAAYAGTRKQADYRRAEALNFQGGELYTYYKGGVFTFRSDGLRQNAAFGDADMPLDQMSIHWQSELGSLRTKEGTEYGLGWTGQPAIVKWTRETRSGMNLNAEKKDVSALKEVIVAAQDGKVYFVDLADGQPTRDPIDVGYPLKGSVAVDTYGRPLIAFGQGASIMPNKTGPIGLHFYNLIDQSEAYFLNGRRQDKIQLQYSTNGAFDGTGLFDLRTDSFVVAGENGLLYTIKMNTTYDFNNPTSLTIDPEIIYLRGKTSRQADTSVSIESSAAMYGPYAFYADKQGILRAVDTTTMQTIWAFDTGDNTDASPALDLENGGALALYTGTTVHARTQRAKVSALRRINALTGEEMWKVEVPAGYNNKELGGLKASPVVGQGILKDLVIFTVNLTDDGATMLALNKQTGNEAWRLPIPGGAISSPVAVYTKDGRARVIQAGLDGTLYLVDGASGRLLHSLDLEGAIEGSPAVYNDILVIGTSSRDNHRLYGIRLE